jgi:hypothetical protein
MEFLTRKQEAVKDMKGSNPTNQTFEIEDARFMFFISFMFSCLIYKLKPCVV